MLYTDLLETLAITNGRAVQLRLSPDVDIDQIVNEASTYGLVVKFEHPAGRRGKTTCYILSAKLK